MSDSREQILQQVYQKGFEFEKTFHGCAQCTIAALQEFVEIDDAVFKAASALSGGMCRLGKGPCGGFSGGLLILGYLLGRDKQNYGKAELTSKASEAGHLLKDKFIREYGSYVCHDIQEKIFGRKFNLLDEEEYQLFEQMGGHTKKCPDVVGKACRWIAEILMDKNII